MYKLAFLNSGKKYDFFAESIKCIEDFEVDVLGFDYKSLSEFKVYDYDILLVSCSEENLHDIEVFLSNIRLFYTGAILVIDSEFSMKRKFIFSELGVNNYFYLPIDFVEFANFLPWFVKQKVNLIKYKDVVLNTENRTVSRGKDCLILKNMEFRLMKFLMQNKGRIMSKDKILSEVWDMNSLVCSKTVEVHICRLRKKIDQGYDDKLLHTVPNTGYMLR